MSVSDALKYFRKFKALLTYHIVMSEKRCKKTNCVICGVNDCPFDDPTHYFKGGCNACQLSNKLEEGLKLHG